MTPGEKTEAFVGFVVNALTDLDKVALEYFQSRTGEIHHYACKDVFAALIAAKADAHADGLTTEESNLQTVFDGLQAAASGLLSA